MSIHLVLNQKTFHIMLVKNIIQEILNQRSRKVTKKEDKKCIVLKMAKLSHMKSSCYWVVQTEQTSKLFRIKSALVNECRPISAFCAVDGFSLSPLPKFQTVGVIISYD